MQLHNEVGERPGTKLKVQRKPLPVVGEGSRAPVDKMEEELAKLNLMKLLNPNFTKTHSPPSYSPKPSTIGGRAHGQGGSAGTDSSVLCPPGYDLEMGMVSPPARASRALNLARGRP